MAINSNEKLCDRSCSKSSNESSCRLLKTDYVVDSGSGNSKQNESKKKKCMSPYLKEDRIQLLSRITEKRLVRKKTTDFVSSFPLAANIYKANSDEFKSLKKSKKVKKSVLTLPNEPAPMPQVCTVSDMNDSEYFNEIKDERQQKVKKRRTNRKPRVKSKGIDIFDRDARYCSQLNINLDSSSTDMINQFTGDGKKCFRKSKNSQKKSAINAHDVWAMLRNMNRFPFTPSPPASLDSVESVKKTKYQNKLRSKDTKFIETCSTELTYISSLVDKTPHNSQSSIDRITVIDKQDDYQEIHEELKIIENKIPSKEKKQKSKIKTHTKNKLHAGPKQNNVRDEGDNNKIGLQFISHKPINNFHLESNVRAFSSDNKKKLTEVTSNNRNICCQHNITSSITYNDDLNNCTDILCWNLDSSNGVIIKNLSGDDEDHNKFEKLSPSESQLQMNGITKVVLSKGQNILLTKKAESLKRKPRVTTTMPTTSIIPKLTQTEIKRRLAKIRFPLIILSKEEVSSTIQVTNYQPPQFSGLDEHIWPFMRNWCKNDNIKGVTNNTDENNRVNDKTVQSKNGDCNVDHNKEIKNNVIKDNSNLGAKNKGKKCLESSDKSIVQTIPTVDNINKKICKSKPIRQFKDRMLQFLHKKSTVDNNSHNKSFSNDVAKQRDISGSSADVGTSIDFGLPIEQYELSQKEKLLKYEPTIKHQWAKGKWASDFIENVIKKIKNGVYYNQDEKHFTKDTYFKKDNSVQTEIDVSRYECCKICKRKANPIVAINDTRDTLKLIPGFDESLSDLQIESINQKQIAIKHCITNVVVQFDVALTSEINHVLHMKQSISCIPLEVTKSQTKIFKSETTIVNAKLPAELCSILPKIMRKIVNSRGVLPKIVDKVESHLSTIDELTRCESGDSLKRFIPIHINTSPDIQNLCRGTFSDKSVIIAQNAMDTLCLNSNKGFYSPLIDDLMLNVNIGLILNYQIKPITLRICESQRLIFKNQDSCEGNKRNNSNMQIQLYPYSERQVVPAYRKFDLNDIMIDILSKYNFIIMPLTNDYNALFYENDNTLSLSISNNRKKVSRINSNLNVDSLYNGFQDHDKDFKRVKSGLKLKKQKLHTVDKYVNYLQVDKAEGLKNGAEYCTRNIKNKKRSFIKPHKKCKSMSSISNERSSVALDKIKNFDDFFVALGTARTLTSVFDGNVERKVLTSVKEMNNWISYITPRQAMLVLLLANKKDNSNLLRYRPVILQGIAVNRITRASELDMETEVIERENLNTFSQYEGIYYLPASVENHDTLLEELQWIAKTTASDYQRPFDDSSERLLKSLLEKRKKLNPSYLRVMARYVGLGLLKPSK